MDLWCWKSELPLQEWRLPVLRLPEEESVAPYPPIQRGGAVAGSFVVTSPQPDFFTQRLQYLLQIYAYPLSLAFETDQFYPPEARTEGQGGGCLHRPPDAARPAPSRHGHRGRFVVWEGQGWCSGVGWAPEALTSRKTAQLSVGARVVGSGRVGLYGRPWVGQLAPQPLS